MPSQTVELLQFRFSHFNEKARWALDWKRVPHLRRDMLPGPHMPQIKKLTGQSMVPVVCFGDEIVNGSARIIDELERRYPAPPLYPDDPEERAKALEIQAWFDDEVGPKLRRALFAASIQEPGYVCRMFSGAKPLPVRLAYRASFPLVLRVMSRSMDLADGSLVEEGYRVTDQALDFVAKEAGPDGHLVGDRFSVADLAAAALLAPACDPPDSPMTRPRPVPSVLRAWTDRWAAHPGTAWVHARYRDHRPAYSGPE